MSEDVSRPGRRRLDPGDHPQQGALSGAARPEHAQELSGGELQIGALQGCGVSLVRAVDAEEVTKLDQRLTHRATSSRTGPRPSAGLREPRRPPRPPPISDRVASQLATERTAIAAAPQAASSPQGMT